MSLQTFEETTIEKDENGLLWVRDSLGNVVCEAFLEDEDNHMEEMLDMGYILVPYLFEGERVYVQVASEG